MSTDSANPKRGLEKRRGILLVLLAVGLWGTYVSLNIDKFTAGLERVRVVMVGSSITTGGVSTTSLEVAGLSVREVFAAVSEDERETVLILPPGWGNIVGSIVEVPLRVSLEDQTTWSLSHERRNWARFETDGRIDRAAAQEDPPVFERAIGEWTSLPTGLFPAGWFVHGDPPYGTARLENASGEFVGIRAENEIFVGSALPLESWPRWQGRLVEVRAEVRVAGSLPPDLTKVTLEPKLVACGARLICVASYSGWLSEQAIYARYLLPTRRPDAVVFGVRMELKSVPVEIRKLGLYALPTSTPPICGGRPLHVGDRIAVETLDRR